MSPGPSRHDGPSQRLLSRDTLIRLEPGNPEREKEIIEIADSIVNPEPDPGFSHSKYNQKKAEMATWTVVNEALNNAKKEWIKSQDAAELRARLYHAVKQNALVGVKNIVCFGLGRPEYWSIGVPSTSEAMQRGHGHWSLIAHVAALWMADAITEASETNEIVTVYCQDPLYRPQDKVALEMHGFKVLDPGESQHEGFRRVGSDTLVYMIDGTEDAIQVVCKTTRPAGIICRVETPGSRHKGMAEASEFLHSEYDKYVDWLPFYNPLLHNVPGPQTMKQFIAEGQRPLQNAIVWLRKARYNSLPEYIAYHKYGPPLHYLDTGY
ncbi:hypothetical protein F5Y12DRAFT_710572 [Xylaria sp. FL1777]|nr:hypothetical protein F5Y12DRAFT_710572 [Xylaria sp. FL1777]